MPPSPADLLQFFGGSQSASSCPVGVGTPLGAPEEVQCGSLAIAKVKDQAQIPAAADIGEITSGYGQCLVHGQPVAHTGSQVTGFKGTVAGIEASTTDSDVLVPTAGSAAPTIPSLPDWLGDICSGLGALKGFPGVGIAGTVCDVGVSASQVAAAPDAGGAFYEVGEAVAEQVGSSAAVAAVTPACLELTLAAGIAATPLVGGAVGITCLFVAGAGGSIVGRAAYELPGKLKEAQQQQAAAMANKCVGFSVPNPMGGGQLSGYGCPWGGSINIP